MLHSYCYLKILGYGSSGTTVYLGSFEGREVAVKRMLVNFYDSAQKEIDILIHTDEHPSVLRSLDIDLHFMSIDLSHLLLQILCQGTRL